VSSTADMVTNQFAILSFGSTNWVVTVLFTNQATNIFLVGAGALGFTPPTNSVLWLTANRQVLKPALGRNSFSGEALVAAAVRAPLAIRLQEALIPGAGSNRVAATVKYSAYDQVVASP